MLIKPITKYCFLFCLTFCLTSFSCRADAEQTQDFNIWLNGLKAEAKAGGISDETINQTISNAQLLPRVIELDRSQPEFISPFLSYLEKRVDSNKIAHGKRQLQMHADLLVQIEAQYGVPKEVLVAFWGMETNYGHNKGNFNLPSSLMTLAYEGRRSDFFRDQLLSTMRIVDEGHNTVPNLRGSWAGAMGHMQFMPSTMLKYGVDADGDGRVNISASLDDAFASAANYLSQVGWRKDEAISLQVKLPAQFDYQLAQLSERKTTREWQKLGVVDVNDAPLPALENAAILLPQGWQGPAMMVFSNFDVVMDWNKSVNYALSVSVLSQQLLGDTRMIDSELAEKTALSYSQILTLQEKLNTLGFDCGVPDGFPGSKTQAAIRQYQATQQLPQDGFAGPSLYQRLSVQ